MASGARGTYNHREVVDWVRQYFLDEPSSSIDDCCRDAHSLRIAVSRDLISGIRRGLKVLGPAPVEPKPVLTVVPKQPAYFSDKPPPADLFKHIKVEAPREDKMPGEVFVHIDIRRRFYDDVLLGNPAISITKAMKAVKAKFGRSVDVNYALQALRLIRELNAPKPVIPSKTLLLPEPMPAKVPMAPTVQKPTTPTPPAATAKNGVCLVRWYADKAKDIMSEDKIKEVELKAFITKLVGEGVAPNLIEVWDPRPLKLQVQIDF